MFRARPKDIYNKKGEFIRHDDKAEQISEVKSTRKCNSEDFSKDCKGYIHQAVQERRTNQRDSSRESKECCRSSKSRGSRDRKVIISARKERESSQQQLLPLPGYERKTRLAEIAEDHIEDMRRAVADISWYYSKSGDYKNNAAFKAGNPWGWARKDSQGGEGLVASLDEEGPDSKIIFDDEEFWFDETAEKIWRREDLAWQIKTQYRSENASNFQGSQSPQRTKEESKSHSWKRTLQRKSQDEIENHGFDKQKPSALENHETTKTARGEREPTT